MQKCNLLIEQINFLSIVLQFCTKGSIQIKFD